MAKTKQPGFSWRVKVSVFAGALIMGLVFIRFRRFELARPTFFSIVVIVFAMALKWELRSRAWFWAVMLTTIALHVLLILYVPWTARWIPALVMTPIAVADVAGIVALITLMERQLGRAGTK